ncbi:hypothetical protein [Coxiella endosymbiont of Ornithodoros amblus]|uniref:hypothetical protein n=1 Tax=Coxiella endosymbiont of Ornithodoros amblus TaxID=1656166 RepID=UPI00244E4998|nr:hypothetical protein [Coxiella endosymbiont of Ornithodoros amblus]
MKVSPHENLELWRVTIGGYGLVGVTSDVAIQLVPDNKYIKIQSAIDRYSKFKSKI